MSASSKRRRAQRTVHELERACARLDGRIETHSWQPPGLGRSIPYRLYLPPTSAFGPSPAPLLVHLHGLVLGGQDWDDPEVQEAHLRGVLAVCRWIEAGIDEGLLPPVAAAFPLSRCR